MSENTPEIVILTDKNVSLDTEFLKQNANIIHLAFKDTGEVICIDEVCYKGKRVLTRKERYFPSSMKAGLSSYLYSQFRHAAETGLLVYGHSLTLFNLLNEVIQKSGLPFAIWLTDTDAVGFNWKQQHFVSSAIARFCFSPDIKKRWQSTLVYDCDYLKPGELSAALKACSQRFEVPYTPTAQLSDIHKCLVISYFASPSETVAVHRISYWHENLPKIAAAAGQEMTVDVMTANNSYKTRAETIYVADSAELNCTDSRTDKFAKKLDKNRVNYFSAYWASHIRDWLLANPGVSYDSVVISGNPFYYFELAGYLRHIWSAKIILDFRDPFANNPRFKFTDAHKKIVCDLEDEYLKNADYALSVNQHCLNSLRLPDNSMGLVVANGYDERITDHVQALPLRVKDRKISFVYTGSFYADRNPEPFLKRLVEKKHKLIHIGRAAKTDEHLDEFPTLERYGMLPYEDVIKYCKSMSAGLIFTSGKPFEQTTKIFDYIASDIDIIIVTEGRIKTGELHRITKDMTGVHWVKNDEKSIAKFLSTYKSTKYKRKNREDFSRLNQTKKLHAVLTSDT